MKCRIQMTLNNSMVLRVVLKNLSDNITSAINVNGNEILKINKNSRGENSGKSNSILQLARDTKC